jgi:dTDP-4-amino-4,6-dideoxygalactose transaminase
MLMPTDYVPFNRASLAGAEFQYIKDAIETMHIAGDGKFTKKCHRFLEDALGVSKVLLTTSCTHALEMAALLLDFKPGDEVVVPSFTFVSTVNAFVLHGATPVFVDVRPDTLNMDERLLEKAIGPRTRAVVPVHYAGVACEMDTILALCRPGGVSVVEDNAHGLFARYRGRPLGTFGALATLSFHETKNFTCGEGGALLVNDPAHFQRAEILREKGTNRSRFFRGEIDKYTWVDVGSSYLPSEILAAFLAAQLEAHGRIQARRREMWDRYLRELCGWAEDRGLRLPVVPDYCEQAYHLFYLLLPSLDIRQRTIARLNELGVHPVFHYQPLHLSEMGRKFGGRPGACPVTEDVSDRLLRLPLYNAMTDDQQERVIWALKESI